MWGEQTSLRKDCYRETDFRKIVSQVGQESEKNFIFNTMSLFGDNKLPIPGGN